MFLYCGPTVPQRTHLNLIFSSPLILEKHFSEIFSYVNTCNNGVPYCEYECESALYQKALV
jgi:hypothetical protein